MAEELVQLPGHDLSFCWFHGLNTIFQSIDYQKTMPVFSDIPFIQSGTSYYKKKQHQYRLDKLNTQLNGGEELSTAGK